MRSPYIVSYSCKFFKNLTDTVATSKNLLSNPNYKFKLLFFLIGIWWTVTNFGEISGTIAIEMDKGTYIHALDNGLFTLGAPHKEGSYLVEAMEGRKPHKECIL